MTVTIGAFLGKKGFNNVNNQVKDRDRSMTICIGAVCDDGKTVVILSDKKHYDETMEKHFFEEEPKLKQIHDKCYIGYFKDDLLYDELIKRIKRDKKFPSLSLQEVPTAIYNIFMKMRNEKADEQAFGETIFENKINFIEKQKLSSEGTIRKYDTIFNQYYFDLSVLIAGIDKKEYCLTTIETSEDFPISKTNYKTFVTIGNGSDLSMSSLRFNDYCMTLPLDKALYLLFEAKEKSKHSGHVGDETDIVILRRGKKPLTFFTKKSYTPPH
jgi:hypothetical protein